MKNCALLVLALGLFVGGSTAWAEDDAANSCEAELQSLDASFRETQQRVESAWDSNDDDKKCAAVRHHLEVMRHAGDVFDRCMTGHERDENVGQMIDTIEDFEYAAEDLGCP